MSEQTLVQKLADVMAEVGYVQKDGKLAAFPYYTYATSEKVYEKVREALSELGIAVSGDCELVFSEVIETADKKLRHLAMIKHTLTFTDGTDSLSVSSIGGGMDSGDKAAQKADTVAVKYCLAKAFLISWGDDPEADDETDGPENEAISIWLELCEKASGSPLEKFKGWWPTNKAKILAE